MIRAALGFPIRVPNHQEKDVADMKQRPLLSQVGLKLSHQALRVRHAQAVNDQDFRSDAKGMAIPYGVYDPQRNHGFVAVGTSRETPAFAVDAICLWWQCCGQKHYPEARELLILADSGGGNGARVRAWKYPLQHKLANRYQLSVTVTHYPPGTPRTLSLKPPPGSPGSVESGG